MFDWGEEIQIQLVDWDNEISFIQFDLNDKLFVLKQANQSK